MVKTIRDILGNLPEELLHDVQKKGVLLDEPADDLLYLPEAVMKDLPVHAQMRINKYRESRRGQVGAAGAPGRPEDVSLEYCAELLDLADCELPSLENLHDYMRQTPHAIVVDDAMNELLRADAATQLKDSLIPTSIVPAFQLARKFSSAMDWPYAPGRGEPMVSNAVNHLVLDVLRAIDTYAPADLAVHFQASRDVGDSDSLMTLLSENGKPLRPDMQFRANDGLRLLAKVEEKDTGSIQDAVDDLEEKTAVWSPLYYGDLPYLLCIAAADRSLGFYVITPDVRARLISQVFQMDLLSQRPAIVSAVIQFYKLMAAATKCLPITVVPVGKDIISKSNGITRVIYFRADKEEVMKKIDPWDKYSRLLERDPRQLLQTLTRVYEIANETPYLIHCVSPPLVDADDKYHVELEPVGIAGKHAQPRNIQDWKQAAVHLLQGLEALHQAGFVHGDPRAPNIAKTLQNVYYWLDLEMAGAPSPSNNRTAIAQLVPKASVDGQYTCKSDVYCLGCILRDWASTLKCSKDDSMELQKFLMLLAPVEGGRNSVDAAAALQNEWLRSS